MPAVDICYIRTYVSHVTNTEGLNASLAGIFEELRSNAGISVNALAERSGIPQPTLRRRLNGAAPFTTTEIEQLAGALGTPLRAVLDRAGRAA